MHIYEGAVQVQLNQLWVVFSSLRGNHDELLFATRGNAEFTLVLIRDAVGSTDLVLHLVRKNET